MKLPEQTEIDKDGGIFFKGIDLEDSFLLGMHFDQEQGILCLNVDLSIWPESIYYRKPSSDEWTCYRKAKINIIGVNKIIGLFNLDEIKPSTDLSGEKDWDCIYGLRTEQQMLKFEICDKEISIIAEGIQLIVE